MDTTRSTISNFQHPEYFFWAAVVLILFSFSTDRPTDASTSEIRLAAAAGASSLSDPFADIELEAKSVYVLDATSGRAIFEKNATSTNGLASITKVMTAAVALSLVPDTTFISIEAPAVRQEGDSDLKVGEKWLLRDLVTLMLLESSNDAAYAISSSVGAYAEGLDDAAAGRESFIVEMNARGSEWGLRDTIFRSESGLDLPASETAEFQGVEQEGALSTARDTAHLLAYALKNFPTAFTSTKWSELRLENEDGEVRNAVNTNKETNRLPLLLASKTGYTDLSGGNLVIAFDAGFNRPIIVAVLGSSAEGRFADVEKLVWATLDALNEAN